MDDSTPVFRWLGRLPADAGGLWLRIIDINHVGMPDYYCQLDDESQWAAAESDYSGRVDGDEVGFLSLMWYPDRVGSEQVRVFILHGPWIETSNVAACD